MHQEAQSRSAYRVTRITLRPAQYEALSIGARRSPPTAACHHIVRLPFESLVGPTDESFETAHRCGHTFVCGNWGWFDRFFEWIRTPQRGACLTLNPA